MLKITAFLSLFSLCLNASVPEVNFNQIHEKNGFIYKSSKKFTGSFQKKDAKVFVKNGKISKLDIYFKKNKIASFDVRNNQFNGKAYVNHESLGRQDLVYKNGCIQSVETKKYKEVFSDCNFKSGLDSFEEKYTLSSNYPYVVELDVFSFNINDYVFKRNSSKNGMTRDKSEKRVFRNSKLKRYIINVPTIGINYVINFNNDGTIHSLSKFYLDSESSLIAFFENEDLKHIISFNKKIKHIEKYKNGKLVFKQNIKFPKKKDFDLLRNMQDIISVENGKIYPYIILEKLKGEK